MKALGETLLRYAFVELSGESPYRSMSCQRIDNLMTFLLTYETLKYLDFLSQKLTNQKDKQK